MLRTSRCRTVSIYPETSRPTIRVPPNRGLLWKVPTKSVIIIRAHAPQILLIEVCSPIPIKKTIRNPSLTGLWQILGLNPGINCNWSTPVRGPWRLRGSTGDPKCTSPSRRISLPRSNSSIRGIWVGRINLNTGGWTQMEWGSGVRSSPGMKVKERYPTSTSARSLQSINLNPL